MQPGFSVSNQDGVRFFHNDQRYQVVFTVREVQYTKQSDSFTVTVKYILEILARQIFMVLRYVHQESLHLLKMWILPTKEESLFQLQLVLCIIKQNKLQGSVKCENGIYVTRLHVFCVHV